MFARWENYPSSLNLQDNVTDITKFVIITQDSDFTKGENGYKAYLGTENLKRAEAIVQNAINLFNSVSR